MIKWLFFDLGSTIIDETDCEDFRMAALLRQVAQQNREEVLHSFAKFAALNKAAYKETVQLYGLKAEPWPMNLEKLYPDAMFVLSELKKKYHLGIIANQNPGTIERLKKLSIDTYFEVIAASGDLGIIKPDPAIFSYVLANAGCEPHEAMMIGDRLDNDIAPANAIGMGTIWIKQGMGKLGDPDLLPQKPDFTVKCLTELLSIL